MLQTLTLSYPDRLNQLGPIVQVLFTDFSKFDDDPDSSSSSIEKDKPSQKNKIE
jgi:hypothetical protein